MRGVNGNLNDGTEKRNDIHIGTSSVTVWRKEGSHLVSQEVRPLKSYAHPKMQEVWNES